MKRMLALAAVFALPAAGLAQTVTGIRAEPSPAKVGEPVTITVSFEVEQAINCGLRLHYGDGTTGDYKINQQRDVPLVVKYTYRKPGDYHVMAEPKTVGTLLKCLGKNQATMLKVAGAVATPAPKAAVAAGPQCPPGWTLDAKSVNKKTGAFTCSAKPGTKAPAARLSCPGELSYFENEKKGLLGCRS